MSWPSTFAPPAVGVEQAEQDLDERALARAVGADQPMMPGSIATVSESRAVTGPYRLVSAAVSMTGTA